MNIFCLCMVRDEIDVIPHTLDAARRWAKRIFVLDNGSTDGTWPFLQSYAEEHAAVILVGRESGPFRGQRGEIASRFLHEAEPGDWWCRLDADEIYIDDPAHFLAGIDDRADVVWSASVQYYFTDEDLRLYQSDADAYTVHWTPERARYYQANWSEPRFVRHARGRRWARDWPKRFGWLRPAQERIRLRHFQYRSPPQIQRRLLTRRVVEGAFRHEKGDGWLVGGLRREHLVWPAVEAPEELWRTRVVRADVLHHDTGSGHPIIDPGQLPPITPHLPVRLLRRVSRLARS